MNAEQFRIRAQGLFGEERGWQTKCANQLGIDQGTVSRYLSGMTPISQPIQRLLACLSQLQARRHRGARANAKPASQGKASKASTRARGPIPGKRSSRPGKPAKRAKDRLN